MFVSRHRAYKSCFLRCAVDSRTRTRTDSKQRCCQTNHFKQDGGSVTWPRSGELRTQKLKSPLMRTQSLKVLPPLKPGVGQYIDMHATLTARDFFFANVYPSGPFTFIFFQSLSRVFPVLAVANTGSRVGQQNKIGHPALCRVPCLLLLVWSCVPKVWIEFELWFEQERLVV